MKLRTITSLAMLITVAVAGAQTFPCDHAVSGAYGGGWLTGTNGGLGFNPWVLTSTFSNPSTGAHFRATSNTNGSGGGPGIDIFGFAWGTYAHSGDTTVASRSFLAPVTSGEIMMFDLDTGDIQSGGSVRFELYDGSTLGASISLFGGASNYAWLDASGSTTTSILATDGGIHLDLQVFGTGAYSLMVTRLVDSAIYTQNGTFAGGALDVTSFKFINQNAGPGLSHEAYLNHVCVVPEPTSMAALGIGLVFLKRRRSRHA